MAIAPAGVVAPVIHSSGATGKKESSRCIAHLQLESGFRKAFAPLLKRSLLCLDPILVYREAGRYGPEHFLEAGRWDCRAV
jgi:hypothetical protein